MFTISKNLRVPSFNGENTLKGTLNQGCILQNNLQQKH